MCSNYPGGRAGWEADQGSRVPLPVAPVERDPWKKLMKKNMMEEDHPWKKLMKKNTWKKLKQTWVLNLDYQEQMFQQQSLCIMGIMMVDDVYYIITDSSDPTHADIITESQGWKVELAPLLKNTPEEALSKVYTCLPTALKAMVFMDIKIRCSLVLLHKQMCIVH